MQAEALGYLRRNFAPAIIPTLYIGAVPEGTTIEISTFVTPRRLAVIVKDLPLTQPDTYIERKGPKVDAPEAAIQGFLKSAGMKLEQLEKRDGIYFANIYQKGRTTAEVLKEMIEEMLSDFPWPKSMRWGSGDVTWVRPLHSILCIFDGKIIPVQFGNVKAGNITYGHRFLSPGAITVNNSADYESALEKACVIANREKRKSFILEQAQKTASTKGLAIKPDDGLLEEVTGLVEWPVVLMGSIDAKFMDLPSEVLVSEMRTHQKYFALLDKTGVLSPQFLVVANMKTSDGGKAIVAGNERVLRARLSDGRFFWDQDRKKSLDDWAEGLKSVTFHAKLGSIADKVERIKALSFVILSKAKNLDPSATLQDDGFTAFVTRAAALCKADLVTGMVGEFPELQGVMGWYYATAQKEAPEVADAIRDHYLPLGPSSPVPTAPVSICIALADKLDTLIFMFAIGEKPTGSKDPFALRRAALGSIRLILENSLRLPLKPLLTSLPLQDIALRKAHDKLVQKTEAKLHEPAHKVGRYVTINESAYEDIVDAVAPNFTNDLLAFFHDRLKVQLKDSGIRHDVINAVVADGDDDLVRIVARAKALQDFLGTDDGTNLLTAYKRAANILAIEEKKDKTRYEGTVDTSALIEKEEIALTNALFLQFGSLAEGMKREAFTEVMKTLSNLRTLVDGFFEKTLVNVKDNEKLRINRLRLLAKIRDIMDSIANFSLIEG